jgi:hypothetical protein
LLSIQQAQSMCQVQQLHPSHGTIFAAWMLLTCLAAILRAA